MRLQGKTAIIVGAGQTPGETLGNGRAMSLLFAREGAEILCVDRLIDRAEETASMIVAEGGKAAAFAADITKAGDCAAMIEAAKARWDRVDILVNNVGIGGGGDGPATSTAQANAAKGVRCNAIAMGLMDTPMAVAGIASSTGQEQQAVRDARNARVPLGGQMGTAWDTAYAALFLASDEARFITGVVLWVDGGMSSRIG